MSEETTRAAVTDLYSAYAGGDGERMAALIADDVDFIIYGPVQVFPFAGHHQGSLRLAGYLGVTS
jgi:ketosteroid isomerase-like protein